MKTSNEILLFLLKKFEKKISINQIAKLIKRAPSGVFKELEKFEKKNIVSGKMVGNAKIYELNLENLETIKICELLLMTEKDEKLFGNPLASILAKDIKKMEHYADVIVMFGSVLEKKEPGDIDVFIITKPRFIATIEKSCREISMMHGKSVNPLILSQSDFVVNIRKQDKVILNIIEKGIVLKGYEKFVRGIKDAKI